MLTHHIKGEGEREGLKESNLEVMRLNVDKYRMLYMT
jgi:hypothetical protein